MSSARSIARASAAVTGLFAGIGLGLLFADGRIWPSIAVPLLALGLYGGVRLIAEPDDRSSVGAIVALSFAFHVAMAVVLFTGALAAGRGGFIPGDDAEYAFLSRTFVAYLKGQPDPISHPPYWAGEAYLFGTWVYLESAIFYLIGPEVLVPILLNGAFAVATALLTYSMARQLFGRGSALVALGLTAFFPSLVLWSSLNLKDALALFLIALCLWALVRFHGSPRWWAFTLAFAALVPMESLRRYIFVGCALLIPLVIAATPRLRLVSRATWTVPAVALSAILISATQSGVGLGPQLLESFEATREAMSVGARTSFVEPPPQPVKEGDTFVVAGPSPSASASPRTVRVAPNTRIVVAATAPEKTLEPDVVVVHPGDMVVVGPPDTTPAPQSQWRVIPLSVASVQLRPEQQLAESITVRTVEHLPTGLLHAFLAPFPWSVRRIADLATIPDMLIWYAALVAAAVTLVRERSRWQEIFVLVAISGGLLLLFALVEGNLGTLYRHRAMAIPWVLLLASPTISKMLRLHRFRSSPAPVSRT